MTFVRTSSLSLGMMAPAILALFTFLYLNNPASQAVENTGPSDIVFDITKISHRFDGFGVQIVARDRKPDELKNILRELNIKYVRVENSRRADSWQDIQKIRKLTDSLGIKWIYMTWRGPRKWEDSKGNLKAEHVDDFAQWWADEVAELNKQGVRTEYIELMNEPDSDGQWSKGISPENYCNLVKAARVILDKAGFEDVRIVGPGATHLNWDHHSRDWIDAMDGDAVEALAAWSAHCWDDGDICYGGAACIEQNWKDFGQAITRKGEKGKKPIIITEYATKENKFFGITYPHPEHTPGYNATNTVPYAVRVYENTLALANSGANVLCLWMARDQGWNKAWGLLDFSGTSKPVHYALKTLFPKIPVGSHVLKPVKQGDVIYAGAFVKDNHLVLGLSNDSDSQACGKVKVLGKGKLTITEAQEFMMLEKGDPATEKSDKGRVISKVLTVNSDNSIDVKMPADSTLTITCNFEQ